MTSHVAGISRNLGAGSSLTYALDLTSRGRPGHRSSGVKPKASAPAPDEEAKAVRDRSNSYFPNDPRFLSPYAHRRPGWRFRSLRAMQPGAASLTLDAAEMTRTRLQWLFGGLAWRADRLCTGADVRIRPRTLP